MSNNCSLQQGGAKIMQFLGTTGSAGSCAQQLYVRDSVVDAVVAVDVVPVADRVARSDADRPARRRVAPSRVAIQQHGAVAGVVGHRAVGGERPAAARPTASRAHNE